MWLYFTFYLHVNVAAFQRTFELAELDPAPAHISPDILLLLEKGTDARPAGRPGEFPAA
jgi:hypothetical protein